MTLILKHLKHIVTYIGTKLKLFEVNKTGRPLAINPADALAFALYQHRSTRSTKKSMYDDFGMERVCTYKTFVVAISEVTGAPVPVVARWATSSARLDAYAERLFARMLRKQA